MAAWADGGLEAACLSHVDELIAAAERDEAQHAGGGGGRGGGVALVHYMRYDDPSLAAMAKSAVKAARATAKAAARAQESATAAAENHAVGGIGHGAAAAAALEPPVTGASLPAAVARALDVQREKKKPKRK